MRAKRKNRLKMALDVGMTLLLLCLMAYQVTGEALHEWCGVAMTVLLLLHHVLNARWYGALFKGRYTALRVVTLAVNTLLLAAIALTAVCGMAMSAHALPFLYGLLPVSFARQVHLALSHWSFVLMGVHLGLHIPAMTAGLRWSRRLKTALAAAVALAAAAGCWLFLTGGIPDYLFFRAPFAFLDYDKPALAVFAENAAMLIFFAFAGAVCAAGLRAAGRRHDPQSKQEGST